MAAKRAAKQQPKPERAERSLSKAEACKVLQVAPAADAELVTKAYWHLAREARAFAKRDPEARKRLDALNRAYLVLNPTLTQAPLENGELPPPEAPSQRDFFAAIRRVIEQTASRWPEHVPEVTVLTITTAALTFLALESGANILATVIAAGAAAFAIWAPWRRA
jgi:hypothetical protein